MLFAQVVILSFQKSNSELPPCYHSFYVDEEETGHVQFKRYHDKFRTERGITIPDKLTEKLQKVEQLLFSHAPVSLVINKNGSFQVLLEDFSMCTFTINEFAGIHDVQISSNFAPPNKPPPVNRVQISHHFVVASAKSIPQLMIIQPKKSSHSIAEIKKNTDLLVNMESTQEVVQNLFLNASNELLLVVFKKEAKLFGIGAEKGIVKLTPNPIGEIQIKAERLQCVFSKNSNYKIISIEENRNFEVKVASWMYDMDRQQLDKLKVSLVKLGSRISCFEPNKFESRILFGCSDGVLALYDIEKVTVKKEATSFKDQSISIIRWHPSEAIIALCTVSSVFFIDLQMKILPIKFEFGMEEPSVNVLQYLSYHAKISQANWMIVSSGRQTATGVNLAYDDFILVFDRGPAVLIRVELGALSRASLTFIELFVQYLSNNQVSKALLMMTTIKNLDDLFMCFSFMVTHVLKDEKEEAQAFLRSTFAKYTDVFSNSKFETQYHNLLTRFFHQLLRQGKLEDAFKVANQEKSATYFEDLATWAKYLREYAVADIARSNAIELDPIHNDSQWDKLVLGVDAIKEYFSALEETDASGELLSSEDVVRLGLWYESEGELTKAMEFYTKYYMQAEISRLKELISILPKEQGIVRESSQRLDTLT